MARSTYLLALAGWAGSTVFYSFIVLPTLFANLERARAGEVAALLFAGYYRFGIVCGLLLCAACAYFARVSRGGWRLALAVAAVMLVCQGIAEFAVRPQISELRGVAARQADFDRLHRVSVRLNAVVLVGGLGLLLSSGRLLQRT